jgi:ribonuclease H / adenosylcobalamin/alpha-ribazole phosphatase
MLLYLARHAQTASSAVDSFNGRGELPLTARGREQARNLGERLSSVRFAAVVRSPLGRTKDTADRVAPGVPQLVLEGLIEIDYGEWEGLSPAQAQKRNPDLYESWLSDPARIAPPGGETAGQVAERAVAALRDIQDRYEPAGAPVLAVSHKATLRILGACLTDAPIAEYRRRWPQDECALNLVELRAGKEPFLRLWNDTAHLGPDPGANTRGGK